MTFAAESFAMTDFASALKRFAVVIAIAGLICAAAVDVSRAVPIAPLPSAVVRDARAASLPVYFIITTGARIITGTGVITGIIAPTGTPIVTGTERRRGSPGEN